jgi:hypothetical protein
LIEKHAVKMMLPRQVERPLYVNCLLVAFQLIEELLVSKHEKVVFLGHEVHFKLEPQPLELLKQVSRTTHIHHCRID